MRDRRFFWQSGRITRDWLTGFWSPTLTVKDPQIPHLALTTSILGGDATVVIIGIISYLGNGEEITLAEALIAEEGNQITSTLGNEAILADGLIVEEGNSATSAIGSEVILADGLIAEEGNSLTSAFGEENVLADSLSPGNGLELNLLTGSIEIEGDSLKVVDSLLSNLSMGDVLAIISGGDIDCLIQIINTELLLNLLIGNIYIDAEKTWTEDFDSMWGGAQGQNASVSVRGMDMGTGSGQI